LGRPAWPTGRERGRTGVRSINLNWWIGRLVIAESEAVETLKLIWLEMKGLNGRVDRTNQRLERLEVRLDRLEGKTRRNLFEERLVRLEQRLA